ALIGQANRALAARGVQWRFASVGTPGPIATAAVAGIGGIPVARRYRLAGAEGDTTSVLATVNGVPWLVRGADVVLLGSRLDTAWAALPASPAFVPFVDVLVNRLARGEALVSEAEGPPGVVFQVHGADTVGAVVTGPDPRESDLTPAAPDVVRRAIGAELLDEARFAAARALAGDAAAALYPQREALGAEEPHVEIAGERIETLEALLSGKVNILVTTARATAERTAVPAALAAMRVVLAAGLGARGPGAGGLTDVVNRLSAMGYTRVPTVTEVAQFSVRGGILDVYGFGMAAPTRVEWSGDEIVSLRPFDLDSQRSGGDRVERVTILPARSEELSGTGEAQGAAPLRRQSLLDLIPTDALLVLAQESALAQEVDRAWAEAEHHL